MPRSLLALSLLPLASACGPAPQVVPIPDPPPARSALVPADDPAPGGGAAKPSSCRSALAFTPSTKPIAPAARPTQPKVVAGCEATAKASRRKVGKLLDPLSDDEREAASGPLLGCYAAGDGAWTFEITSVKSAPPKDPGMIDGPNAVVVALEAVPVFVPPSGKPLKGSQKITVNSGTAHFILYTSVVPPHTFDWDGDGRGELYFEVVNAEHENMAEVAQQNRYWVFSAKGDAVHEILPEAARARDIEDVDGDGRPDLVLRSPWVVAGPCGIAGNYYPGPELLSHARPDGTFSIDDDTAHGFLAHQCRERREHLPEPDNTAGSSDLPSLWIGCARWWSRSPDDIVRQIDKDFPPGAVTKDGADPFFCFPRDELARVAHIDPPTGFRLTCR